MRIGFVVQVSKLSGLPDEDVGSEDIYQVLTTHHEDANDCFYMVRQDKTKRLAYPSGTPNVSPTDIIQFGDRILYDQQDGLTHKKVTWDGRDFRQKGYSFSSQPPAVAHLGPS